MNDPLSNSETSSSDQRHESSSTDLTTVVRRFIILVFTGCIVFFLFMHIKNMRSVSQRSPYQDLPKVSQVPPFKLTERSEKLVTHVDLRNQVWVANFFFTACPTICPAMTRDMRKLQDALTNASYPLQMVSFSIDPEIDTPEVLTNYANQYGAKKDLWWFLTGDPETIYNVARYGFVLGFVENPEEQRETIGRYAHSTKIALVDKQGFVRSYYESDSDNFIKDIIRDAKRLENQ